MGYITNLFYVRLRSVGALLAVCSPSISVAIMKTPRVKVMKRTTKLCRREKIKAKAYSTYIYRLQKEGNSVSKCITVPKSLSGETFELVLYEAARLSKYNKRNAITRQEVRSAVLSLRPKVNFGKEGA
ncbi:hypothetical protein SKAU_G00233100 [Synaphobranchus kaupii]|uniref:Histone H2A/H2B/H3 domain-containing protein n=1 Tax=Synaphobranchus kaupii TaxID=118154 RepID=A0A9Q1ITG6_SYNKA|nr:hypothetical protein SKAU_G00233100 [Synaphobranchus kaupii]